MGLSFFYFSVILFYVYISFIVYIWTSAHSLSFSKVFYQPLTYWKLTSFKWRHSMYYLFVPWFFILGMVVIIVMTIPFFGGIKRTEGVEQIAWDIVAYYFFSVPFLGAFFLWRSISKVRCVVCKGKKYIEKGFNDLIDLHYSKKTKCYCCHGKGYVKIESELGRAHLVLEQNIELMREHEYKYRKHEKNIKKLRVQVAEGRSRYSQALLDKITAKHKFYKEVFDFYDTTVRKLSHLIREKHIHAEYVVDEDDYSKDVSETMVSKEIFEQETKELLYSIEVMNQRIKLHDYSPAVINDIRKEIKKLND